MPKFSSSKFVVWILFTGYLLFGFGGAVIAACCPDVEGFYQARTTPACQGEACSPVEALQQAATSPSPKETCLDHCSPSKHSRLHLFSGQPANPVSELHGIVADDYSSFGLRPLSAGFNTPPPQHHVPNLVLVALRTTVLLI
jgi:hypothetical protein